MIIAEGKKSVGAVADSSADRVIRKARVLAKINYRKGMDIFLDCYSHEEWLDFVTDSNGQVMEWKEVQKIMRGLADASLDLLKKCNNFR